MGDNSTKDFSVDSNHLKQRILESLSLKSIKLGYCRVIRLLDFFQLESKKVLLVTHFVTLHEQRQDKSSECQTTKEGGCEPELVSERARTFSIN